MQHRFVTVNGAALHLVEAGQGAPLLLLHGWPEFWLTWEPVMTRLQDRFRLIAPDLRGFGDSGKPHGPFGPHDHAADMLALLDALGIAQAGIVGHDVGGAAGIGARMGAPDRLNEIWYQSFHQMDIAPVVVGASRQSCEAYIAHFLRHWAHRKSAFDDVLPAFVENFLKPGNLAGGFAHYRASHAGRVAMMKGEAPPLPPITLPACVRWAEHDPLFPSAWTDRLNETFADPDLAPFPGVGHFPHREDPDRAAGEIAAFFVRIGWR